MSIKTAIKILLALIATVTLFHFCVLVKLIPYDIAWGGRLRNDNEMFVFESISIAVNLFLGFVLLMKGEMIKMYLKPTVISIVLWFFLLLFVVNTLGNLVAKTNFEKSFAVLTLIFALLIGFVLKPKRK